MCVETAEICDEDSFNGRFRAVLDARRKYPFLTGGIYPDSLKKPAQKTPEETVEQTRTSTKGTVAHEEL